MQILNNRGQTYFWLALLGHLLLFLSFTMVINWQWLQERDVYRPKSANPEQPYVPAYLSHESKSLPAMPSPPVAKASAANSAMPKREVDKAGIEKPASQTKSTNLNDAKPLSYSTQRIRENVKGKTDNKPLLKLLYDATAAAFIYPKIAKDFNQTGTTTIRFLVYPNGLVTNITVAKSSGFDILDSAALDAIRRISPVRDVNLYIQKPEYVEAHIIFN